MRGKDGQQDEEEEKQQVDQEERARLMHRKIEARARYKEACRLKQRVDDCSKSGRDASQLAQGFSSHQQRLLERLESGELLKVFDRLLLSARHKEQSSHELHPADSSWVGALQSQAPRVALSSWGNGTALAMEPPPHCCSQAAADQARPARECARALQGGEDKEVTCEQVGQRRELTAHRVRLHVSSNSV